MSVQKEPIRLVAETADTVTLRRADFEALLTRFAGKKVIFGTHTDALTDPDGADRTARAVADGECLIEVVEPAGIDTSAVTHLGGREIIARLRANAHISARNRASLAFNHGKAAFFDLSTEICI